MLKKTALLACTFLCALLLLGQSSFAQTTTFKSGSAIIDMGSATPTVKNSLKPYGLIYALLKNNHVPVNYVVNASKAKDGIDFVYNGKSYKGGTFVISVDYITPAVSTVLTGWANQGVLIDYTNSDLSVTVTQTIKFVPKWVMDKTNGSIGVAFLNSAGIPASAYTFKTPAQLDACDDIFVLPHADPTWATHSNLYDWVRNSKGNIWAGCHAVSELENMVDNVVSPTKQTNFLTTGGLIRFTDHNTTAVPFVNQNVGDPVAQFIGITDNAQLNGSENVYLPKTGSAWNAGAKILTSSPGQQDVPGLSPGPGVENIYGRAFDNTNYGYVAYQASHNIAGNAVQTVEQIAAQRIFFNFSLFALSAKVPPIIDITMAGNPITIQAGTTSATLTAANAGTATGLTYQWTASVAGVFSNPTGATTTFTPDVAITASTSCVITVVATEGTGCSRVSFESKKITVIPPAGGHVLTNVDINKTIADGCTNPSVSFNVFDTNPDPDAGPRTLTNLTGLGGGTLVSNTNGDITFTAAANFKGTTTGTYQVTNGVETSVAKTITIVVGDVTKSPTANTETMSAIVDNVTEVDVLANDVNPASVGGTLYVKDIVQKPTKGYVYINATGTLSYLSNRDLSSGSVTGGDSFQYLACNNAGYCSVATVNVTLTHDGCSTAGEYVQTVSSAFTLSFTPTADASINSGSTSATNGTGQSLFLSGKNQQNGLFKFGITPIPSNATVTSATLSLTIVTAAYNTNVSGTNIHLPFTFYRAARTWDENTATWLNFQSGAGNTWGTPGALNTTTDIVSITSNPTTPVNGLGTQASQSLPIGTVIGSNNIKDIVQPWVSNSATNFGLVVVPITTATTISTMIVGSKENTTASNRPVLTIDYTVPTTCSTTPLTYKPIVYPTSATTTSALSVTVDVIPAVTYNYYGNANILSGTPSATNGTAVIVSGKIQYTPNPTFTGVDKVTYTVEDAVTHSTNTGTIEVTVTRSAPRAVGDNASTASNPASPLVIDVVANDVEPQGSALSGLIITSNPSNGTATVVSGKINYTPSTDFVGTDVFTYKIFGPAADACTTAMGATAVVTVTVTDQPPVAGPGAINTFACVDGSVSVLGIATEPEHGTLSATIATGSSHGATVKAMSDGKLLYIPANGYTGPDAFTYTVTDKASQTSAPATITVNVSGAANPNTAPVAVNDADTTQRDQLLYTNVIRNDSDPNGDVLSLNITAPGLTAPTNGTISVMPNKLIRYTPNSGFVGTDTYQYQLTDTHQGCTANASLNAVGTVTIVVKPIPTTVAGTVWNDADHSANLTFTNIRNGAEVGTNGNGSVYVYVVDNTNKILDRTPVDIDGTYLLSNVPSATSNLMLVLSAADLSIGSTLTAGSVPNGYVNSTPLTNTLTSPTPTTNMTGYDWGIYLNPTLTPGSIIGPSGVCSSNATPGTFTSTSNATGGNLSATGYQYQWQVSIDNGATFGNIAGATETSYTPAGAITTTSNYRRIVSTNLDSRVASNTITVTYVTNPTVSITPTLATIATGGNVGLTATGADTYSWSPATGLSASNVAGVTATPAGTTMYTVTGTLSPSGCVGTATISVVVINPGTITSDQDGCGPFIPNTFTSTLDASGTAGITYQWQSSINNTTFTNIAGANTTTYTPAGAITQTTYYRRVATSGGNSYNSNVITATVNTVPSVNVTPTSAVIALGMTQTFTASGANTYAWSPSSTLSAPNGATVIATPAAGSTVYNVTGTVTATGCSSSATANITVIDPGTIAGSQVNCGAFTPTAFTSTTNASGVAGITYQWQSSANNITFTNIAGATASTYAPAMVNANTITYYRRVATGAGQSYNSNTLSITANAVPTVTIAPTAATVNVNLTQTFTASGADSYSWTPSTYLPATNTASVIAQPTAVGTVTYTVTGTINATGCSSTASVTLTAVSPGSLLPGTIGSSQTICANATPAAFTSTAASGGTGTISYQWQMSTDNVNFTNIPSATAATYGAGTLTQTTYYRRGAGTANDPVVYTPSVKVNVLAKPVIAGGINGVCAMPKDTVKTFSVTAAANATHYVWTLPSTGGWSGSSTTNTINVKAGTTNGVIAVTPYNNTCAGSQVTYNVAIIDYAAVTISGTPVAASGTNNNPITVKIQLIDVLGNVIGCSGGPATLCSSGGTFTNVVDNGDGTYTSYLVSTADQVTICGSVAGVQISNTTKVTFTGPQGGIKSNGPIFDFETPTITFTATDGRAPFTVIYHSDKAPAGQNDTLKNVTSGTVYPVAKIPSTTLYKLVKVIDANGEMRDRNFNRDTTTTRVVIPKVIITLKADPARKEIDSTWATRIVVHTKNIGDLDLANSQARLNLHDVFPSPVTYVLDSVKVSGTTVVQNPNYDGVANTDLFAKLRRSPVYNNVDMNGLAPDGTTREELWNNENDETVVRVGDDGHSIYMFGPQSNLPVGADATIILWLHVKPNGYTEPFVMQAVALGTGHTDGATSLTTSLSNDNDNVAEHPEVTKVGDPVPAVINLFPTASIGVSLNAGAPVLQGNGTYNVLLTYKIKNYGNVNLRNVKLTQNLLSSILAPSTFNVVGAATATGGMVVNPLFNGKTDTDILAIDNILGYKQESTLTYTINITPNQLASVYRLQATASGYSDDLLATVTDLSTDGLDPDPDANNIPSEKVITTIVINTPVPPLTPGTIGIKDGSSTINQKGYCGNAVNVEVIATAAPSGGLDAYQYQWQSSADNVTFKDIVGVETANYTTGTISSSVYLRRATISGSQVKYSNSVYIQIYPTPAVPTITGTGTMVTGKGNITLTSPLATTYLWSTGATTRSIIVTDAGNYTVTVGDVNGCTAVSTAYAITSLEPGKVADVQKILSQAPQLQQDGSFLLTFNIVAGNLRGEPLDSVKITDDLTKVFPPSSTFSIVDIKASGGLIANPSFDGKTNVNLLSDVSKLPGLKKDSVQFTIKVFPNGFSGTLNNVATLLAKSPLGSVVVASNDPFGNSDPAIRLPTKFTLPLVDIFIPSGFSPNRDGYNDKFVITRPYNTTIKMEIYNRWSNLVYKSLDYKNEWEGKGNQANRVMGEDLPDGTYYYEILAVNNSTGQVRKFVGYITLKR